MTVSSHRPPAGARQRYPLARSSRPPVGDLVFKPRGEWHTFWNAAQEPARVLEIISPGGLEEAFRLVDTAPGDLDLGPVIEPYGCEGDFETTQPIIEKYNLTFG